MKTETREARRERMLTEPLRPLIAKLAVPTMIGMMVAVIYNLTDTFWIGRLNDKSMTAAIGVVFSFVSLVQALGFWFGYGSGNVMSRALGAKNDEEAQIICADGAVLAIGTGLLVAFALLPFLQPLAAFLGGDASEKLLCYTAEYLRIMLFAVPFSLFSTTIYNQFRLCGNVKDAMTGLLIGMLANMILDPVLILGFHMAIAGAGWATLTGQVLSCIYFLLFSRRHGNVPVRLRPANFREKRLYHILAGGSPNFTRQGITSLASVLLNQSAAVYGETVLAAFTVSSRVSAIGYLLMIGFGQGFQPVCAMNYGAKLYDRVKKAFAVTVQTGTVIVTISAALLALFAPQLTGILSSDAEVVRIAALVLRLQCISFPLMAFYAVSSMFMQNIGQYGRALVISVARQGIFYLPLLWLLPMLLGRTGLYLVQPTADILSAALAGVIIGIWQKHHS